MPSSTSADFGSCIIACGKRLLTVKIDGVARFNAAAAKVRAQSFTRTATQSSAARRRYGNDALHHRGGVSHGPACPRRAADEADHPPMRCTASGFTHRSSRTDSWVRAPANGGLPKVSFVARVRPARRRQGTEIVRRQLLAGAGRLGRAGKPLGGPRAPRGSDENSAATIPASGSGSCRTHGSFPHRPGRVAVGENNSA
jgi:hypothetical protein